MSELIYRLWRITSFLAIITWRFYLGKPMNGKTVDNSTFTQGATRGRPGKKLSRWQRKPQLHRALIRVAVLWPICGIVALLIWNPRVALLVCACSSIPLGILVFRKGRLVFFQPFMSTDAGNGARTQHWILRTKWRNLLRMQPVPGLVTRRNAIDPDLPPELAKAVAEVLNNELRGGDMPVTAVGRYKRSGKVTRR